jgi:tellurite resistance protein
MLTAVSIDQAQAFCNVLQEEEYMFLNILNKDEKIAFLEMAHHIARSDGDFSVKQKEMISTYCFEMQVDNIEYNDEFDLEKILGKFETEKSKKIVLLEVMALIYSDNIVHKEEEKIINAILEYFGFSDALASLYLEWTKTILAASEQGKLLIEL